MIYNKTITVRGDYLLLSNIESFPSKYTCTYVTKIEHTEMSQNYSTNATNIYSA